METMNTKDLIKLAIMFERKMVKKSEEKREVIEELRDAGKEQGKLRNQIFDIEATTGDRFAIQDIREELNELEEKVIQLRMKLESLEKKQKEEESELGADYDEDLL